MKEKFKNYLLDLKLALESSRQNNGKNLSGRKREFLEIKEDYTKKRINTLVDKIADIGFLLSKNINKNNPDTEYLLKIASIIKVRENITQQLPLLIRYADSLKKSEDSGIRIEMPKRIAQDIRSEIYADIKEVKKSFDSGCFRAATILCGRIMEVCLHRKYYEATGVDLLEKVPGIGLGKLIAKMSEKGIKLDPGLPQQIHLINQIRIYSVHKKSESFYPSKAQTKAIILYTLDIIEKLF